MNDRVQELRRDLDAAREQAAKDAATASTRAAYAAEREGLVQRIARLRTIDPDTRFVLAVDMIPADLPTGVIGVLGPTVADLVAGVEANLRTIDDTLEALEAPDGM
jgi:hypothetical protein